MATKMTRRLTGFLAGAGVLIGGASIASADTVQLATGILPVKLSDSGRVGRETGAGVMMAALTQMENNKILVTWMDSDVQRIDSGWQGKVAVIQLNADAAPSIVTPPTQITAFQGNRPFNHPAVDATPDGKYALINFASTLEDGQDTNQYVMVVDSSGTVLTPHPIEIDSQDGGNHGAASIHSTGANTFIAGYQHNNNESWVAGLTLDTSGATPKVNVDWNTLFYRPTNIGRPEIAVINSTTAVACTEVGNNRPPEVGIGCAVMDVTNGNVVKKTIVAKSLPNQKQYMNQATVAYMGNNVVAVGAGMSDGAGRDNNRLGANTSMLLTIDATSLAVIDQTNPATDAVAPFQRHAQLVSTMWADTGATSVASIGCSSTGSGGAGLQMVQLSAAGMIQPMDKQGGLLPVATQCDTAYLANAGLRNPRDQGRDFIRHIGSVANPSFNQPHGWMPEVSHFAVAMIPAVDPSKSNDPQARNSLYMSFIPTAWMQGIQVTMSGVVNVSSIPTGPSPTSGTTGGTGTGTGTGTGAGTGSGSGDTTGSGSNGKAFGPHDSSDSGGCAVVPGNSSNDVGALAFVGLALGLAVARSRKRG